MRIIGNLAQPLDIAVVSRLIDRAGELLVGLDLVGLVRKAVGMVEADEFFPERAEFVLFVAAQLPPVGGRCCCFIVVGVGLCLGLLIFLCDLFGLILTATKKNFQVPD